MKFERDSNRPSIDLVMHVSLGVVLFASVVAYVDWPLLLEALV